jgi:DNA polymerase-3 subunit alpha
MSRFVHLHTHSEYSLLDGIIKHSDLIERLRALNMDAVAITDHGNLYGALEFYRAFKDAGIKPIIGCEMYVAPRRMTDTDPAFDKSPYHLVLLCKDRAGYANLIKLVSYAHKYGVYYKPRIDFECLADHKDGLIAMTACLSGVIAKRVLQQGKEAADAEVKRYIDLFGPENFYLEMQDHGLPDEVKVRSYMTDAAKRLGVQMVATNDAHYLRHEDAQAHQTALEIATAYHKGRDGEAFTFPNDQFYLRSYEEMAARFSDIPEALANTAKIADACNLELELDKVYFPKFDIPKEYKNDSDCLRKLTRTGAEKRFGSPVPQHVAKRLDHELSVIIKMGFATYFLIVWDFIKYAREHDIPVGPGRGSGAGSLVAYCLEITDIDPIAFDLIFERFLNPERISLPDFDIDFCFERRDEVIKYVQEKYGADSVAQIITFSRLKAKAIIKAVGRVKGMEFAYVNRVTDQIWGINATIEGTLATSPELRKMVQEDPEVADLIEESRKLEGVAGYASVHAAGVVISDGPLENYVPVQRAAGTDLLVTQYAMDTVGYTGLVKMDFLGLRTLTAISEAVNFIRRYEGVDIDIRNIPQDDPETFALFQRGDMFGVFQFERPVIRKIMMRSLPESIEDLTALNALNRPGPLQNNAHEPYIQNRRTKQNITYTLPQLEPILKNTYGVILYQEQVLRIANEVAGYSLGEADQLRRAMGKKDKALMRKQKEKFVSRAVKRGVEKAKAADLFDEMDKFSGYGFSKNHSAPYSLIAYQTAYLKVHYPEHYLAAHINSYFGNSEKVAQCIAECQNMGIEIIPPDVNKSVFRFIPQSGAIVFGLGGIKGVGEKAVAAIVDERNQRGPFTGLADFATRLDSRSVTRACLEALIKAGAFDAFDRDRLALIASLDQIAAKRTNVNQIALFSAEETGELDMMGQEVKLTFTVEEKARMEHDVLGLYLTANPYDEAEVLRDASLLHLRDIAENEDLATKKRAEVGGVLSDITYRTTRAGKRYAQATLNDYIHKCRVILWPETLRKFERLVVEGGEVVLLGAFESGGRDDIEESLEDGGLDWDHLTLLVEKVMQYRRTTPAPKGTKAVPKEQPAAAAAEPVSPVRIEFIGAFTRQDFAALKAELVKMRGASPVILMVPKPSGAPVAIELGDNYCVDAAKASALSKVLPVRVARA